MKKVLLILLTFGLTQTLFCQKTTEEKLDELITAYCKVNKFNGSVLVAQKGKILLEKGYGIKNAQNKTMNDANSIFQTYSITKTVTSTLILKLAELKKMSLTDKLSKFYPEFPKGDSITIENLLTHTSGIYDYTHGNDMKDQSEKSFISFIQTKPLEFSPGTNWSYSNSGYWLLGFIIKKVTNMSYEEAVKEYIFKPLNMIHSGFDFKALSNIYKTTGYEIFSDKVKKEAVIYDFPGPFAAGAVYSTVDDLFKYHNGLQTFKIINEQTSNLAFTPIKNNYGYGWMINSYEGNKTVSHSGGAAGYRSNFVRIPTKDICIILLNNHENANLEAITRKILDILFEKPYELPFEIRLNEETLKRYVGTYEIAAPHLIMYVSVEDGRLAAQVQGQPKTILWAQKESYFFSEEAQGFIEFKKGITGKIDSMVLSQRGRKFTGNRIYPTWGLLGSATAVGWDGPDIQFTQDPDNVDQWILKNIKLNKGEIKFRFNNDWTMNYGDNNADDLLDTYGQNIRIEAGIYNILLDFTDGSKPKYSITGK